MYGMIGCKWRTFMSRLSLVGLVEHGDLDGVNTFLETQPVRNDDVSWVMMQCIKHKQLKILDVLLEHTRIHLKPDLDFWRGPLTWSGAPGESTDLFKHVLTYAPSHYKALSSALTNLMEQEKNGADEHVMEKFELWCDKADVGTLQEALSNVVVWNLPRFVRHLYTKWLAVAPEQKISSELFKNLTHCFSWGELQQGAHIRHPKIYDFLLTQVSPSVAQQFLEKIAHDKSADHFQYMPGTPEIYAILETVMEGVVQRELLIQSVDDGATKTSAARKL